MSMSKAVEPQLLPLVRYQDLRFPDDHVFTLASGKALKGLVIRYECYGKLNAEKSNAILVIHALTASHHAAGKYEATEKRAGWWDTLIGPGKAFDTNKYFVICSNNLGGCNGSTGPNSIDPATGIPYGMNFPEICFADMTNAQVLLMEALGIKKFHSIAGGSMGGMIALLWSVMYPKKVENVLGIACTSAQSAQSIAFSEVARQAIMSDPQWHEGKYFEKNLSGPLKGLAIARMLAHITYLSQEAMKYKFGRKLSDRKALNPSDSPFEKNFEVERYLHYQGDRFKDHFDANSYLYMTKALNYFNLKDGFESLSQAFGQSSVRYLVLQYSSDWIYPKEMGLELVQAMVKANREVSFFEIESKAGHDAFLLEWQKTGNIISAFLRGAGYALKTEGIDVVSKKQGDEEKRQDSLSSKRGMQRRDFEFINSFISQKEKARVLDLGCGEGSLLVYLRSEKKVYAYGVEQQSFLASKGLRKGLSIVQGSINECLPLYREKSFDLVVLSQTVQQIVDPDKVIEQMLRIGKSIVVSFYNYAFYLNRLQFLLKGKKPRNDAFPDTWHESKDIHVMTIADFEEFLKHQKLRILNRIFLKGNWKSIAKFSPNLFAGSAIYHIKREENEDSK